MMLQPKDPKVLVIASAGGHLTQAMCATSKLDNIYLVSNKRNIESPSIKKVFKILDTQHNKFIHFLNTFFAMYVFVSVRPKAVFSTGGPIALPFALLCKIFGIRFIYLDTLSRVTELSNTANLIVSKNLAKKVFVQWESMAKKHKLDYIGKCFDILNEQKYSYKTKALKRKPIIFVTVGTNQYDFGRLFEMLKQQPLYDSELVEWVIQAGHNQIDVPPKRGKVLKFVSRKEMEVLVKDASLVISHCGIGSINLMLSLQKRVFFVPRLFKYKEFSDDHQLQIANEINSDIFTVIKDDESFPLISYELLTTYPLLIKPVDTTNHAMSHLIKKELL